MERYLLKIVCEDKDIKTQIIQLYESALECFIPHRVKLKHYKNNHFVSFSNRISKTLFEKELLEKDCEVYFKDINNSFRVFRNDNNIVHISIVLRREIVTEKFFRVFEQVFSEKGMVAFEHDLSDNVNQNESIISNDGMQKRIVQKEAIIQKRQGWYEVDIEYNPGHMHYVNGLMFGSCYRMWFGKEFYQYISKDKLQSFSNCYENVELENEVTRITLYENLWDYAKEENRARQWDFRRSVGMDEVAHALEDEFSKKKVTDAEVEIKTGKFPHGGVRMIHQYFDENGNLISKSKAKMVKSAEYSADGKILYSEERNV